MFAAVDDNLIGCRRRISDFRRLGALGVLGGETPSPRSSSFIQSAESALSADNIVSSSSTYAPVSNSSSAPISLANSSGGGYNTSFSPITAPTSSSSYSANQPAATYTFNLGNSGSSAYQTPLASNTLTTAGNAAYFQQSSSVFASPGGGPTLPFGNLPTTTSNASYFQQLSAEYSPAPIMSAIYAVGQAEFNAANYVGTAYNDWQQNAPVKPVWLTEMEKSPAFMLVNPEGDIGAVGEEALVTAKNLLQGTENATNAGATFGNALSTDYRATFFAAHPELEGQVVVHHAVPQQTLVLYPDVVTEAQIHSLENLRGIPKEVNSELHLRQIGNEWRNFFKANPNATKAQLLQKATEIDARYGSQFRPPAGRGG